MLLPIGLPLRFDGVMVVRLAHGPEDILDEFTSTRTRTEDSITDGMEQQEFGVGSRQETDG